jgi:high-affinity nickel-transport protein
VRKVFYNLTITGLSVFAAFFIGAVEILGLIAQNGHLGGAFWSFAARFNINTAGFFIVGVFVVTWIVALCVWHFGGVEERWERPREPETQAVD